VAKKAAVKKVALKKAPVKKAIPKKAVKKPVTESAALPVETITPVVPTVIETEPKTETVTPPAEEQQTSGQ